MSKKHYRALARLFVEQSHLFNDREDKVIFAYNLAIILESDNEYFNRDTFFSACGIE